LASSRINRLETSDPESVLVETTKRRSRNILKQASSAGHKKFLVELIKPSHYDDQGYIIQWWRGFIPSNSLSCLYGLALDVSERRALGDDV
jgi:hypothetical protein